MNGLRAFDKHTERTFSVINLFDLNLNSVFKLGHEAEAQKTLCCWPCESDPIIGRLKTNKTGYVPGEFIRFQAALHNQSHKPIKICAVKLIQQMRFHATTKTRSEVRDVALVYCPQPINAGEFYDWSGSLQIPPICSTLNHLTSVCRNIEIEYSLSLYFDVTTFSFSTNIQVPIVVGTVPMQSEDRVQNDVALPSYESCMYGACESRMPSEETGRKGEILNSDENTFKPIYPYFKFD